jgi:hypothetical protein
MYMCFGRLSRKTLRYAILKWGENFMQSHPKCFFVELEVVFCKQYWIMQIDEQVYMAIQVIKQGGTKKVKV